MYLLHMISVPPLTLIGMSYENKKNGHLQRHLGAFHLQKSLENFDTKSAGKILFKNDNGVGKCPPSCKLGFKGLQHWVVTVCVSLKIRFARTFESYV